MIKPNIPQAYRFFRDLTLAFAEIEHVGIKVDTDYLKDTMAAVQVSINVMEEKLKQTQVYNQWRKRYKEPNLDSTQQLAEVLFNVMGHKVTDRTATGKAKADERAIARVKDPFVEDFLKCKKLRKVLGTYLKGIFRETVNGRLHPSYNLAGGLDDEKKGGAMSYRGSSSDPNFQNMPIRNKGMGKLIRQSFVAEKGYLLGEIDFSTIEVRVAACVTKDKRLISYVKDPSKDMHRDTAADMFCMSVEFLKEHKDWAKKGVRDFAKNKFVFPQFYGSYYIDCAQNIWEMMERANIIMPDGKTTLFDYLKQKGIHKRGVCDENVPPKKGTFEAHIKEVERIFWEDRFPEYTAWKKRWYQDYLRSGSVPMPTGFVATGSYRRNQVLNLPIQGPAFHCLGWSIIEIQKELKKRKMKTRIVGQIHDCMLAEIWKPELQDFLDLCKEVMTIRLPKAWDWIIVPLEVEVDIVEEGKSWNDKSQFVQNEDLEWVLKI